MSSFKITRPDGVSISTNLTYSVIEEEVKIYGLIEGYTKIEAFYESIGFTSEGSEADIDINQDGTWVFPNTTEGLDISQGSNSFTFIASDNSGNNTRLELIIVLANDDLAESPSSPTDIRVERGSDKVDVSWVHSDPNVSYYNLYASTSSGGGELGYVRVNALPIDVVSYGASKEKVSLISQISSDVNTIDEDPLIVELNLSQNDSSTTTIGSLEIPENVKRLRVESNVSSTELETRVSFSHNRSADLTSTPPTIPLGAFNILPRTEPLYYVVTSVNFIDGVERESVFSVEVPGLPIDIEASNLGLPTVSDEVLTNELIASIYEADPSASVHAGSAIRDLFVDPVVSEISRVRFMVDFSYRTTNFISLLGIDDPLNTGIPISVASSSYKQTLKEALFLDNDTQVQTLIDQCFERLASNLGIKRREGTKSRGEVTFYTSSTPTFDLEVSRGEIISSGSVSFRTVSSVIIPSDSSANYYNPLTKRYEVKVLVEALEVGSSGNLSSDKVTQGAPLGLRVTNNAPTFGGLDRETNRDLASRALSYISSVDNGTKAGYERIARESAGVESYSVIGAGHEYMIRDQGLGGKVDIWVRGEVLNEVTDIYAPSYKSVRGARFTPLYSEGSYVFLATTATNEDPLFAMIDREGRFGLRNQTTGEFFDLTNATITEGKVITLDSSLDQPTYRLTDIILGDYRTDISSQIVLDRQPVRSISSIATSSGVEITDYTFYKSEDPLLLGQSTKSSDYVVLDNSGEEKIIEVLGEEVTFNGLYPELLSNKGVDISSVRVYNSLNSLDFSNQLTSSSPDYNIYTESNGLTYIQRTSSSSIGSSDTVLVDYEHLENIVVSYTTNLVLTNLQSVVDEEKHMGADVIVKEITPSPVDVKALVYIDRGEDPSQVDSSIRSNLTIRIESEGQGGRVYPSDIIREIDSVVGVSHIEMPLLQLSLAEGTLVLREEVLTTVPILIPEISLSGHQVWICDIPLKHIPALNGGDGARLFLDGVEYPLLSRSQRQTISNWNETIGSIVGTEGMSLNIDGSLVSISNTSQKLVLSLPQGKIASDYKIEINYRVGDSTGYVNSIVLNDFSYLTSGDFSFTYEETDR